MSAPDSDAAIWCAVDLLLADATSEDWEDAEALELQRRAVGLRTKQTVRPSAAKEQSK